MIDIIDFGHLNIIVDCVKKASAYYQKILNAQPIQYFPHFKNEGFAKSAGFLNSPDSVEVSITFLKLPNTSIYLELMCYHHPEGSKQINDFSPHDLGGVRHICLRVKNIEDAFAKIKESDDVMLISNHPDYKPCQLAQVQHDDFVFFDEKLNNNIPLKEQSAAVSSKISFFYFRDQYGVLWELEEAPETFEDPALEI